VKIIEIGETTNPDDLVGLTVWTRPFPEPFVMLGADQEPSIHVVAYRGQDVGTGTLFVALQPWGEPFYRE